MRYNDCHVHFSGGESASAVVAALKEARIDRIGAISPDPGQDPVRQNEAVEWMAGETAKAPDRLLGFAWINPLLSGAREIAEHAFCDLGFVGFKLIPHHWHAYDEELAGFWQLLSTLRAPCIIHTGILWGYGDSSRFCRPVDFEVLIGYPGVRFALAHIGWPWTDECIALAGRFAADDVVADVMSSQEHAPRPATPSASQMYIDITMGAPRPYRREALSRALAVAGDGRLLYGSDCSRPEDPEALKAHLRVDYGILSGELGLSDESIHRIMCDNFESFVRGPDA